MLLQFTNGCASRLYHQRLRIGTSVGGSRCSGSRCIQWFQSGTPDLARPLTCWRSWSIQVVYVPAPTTQL